MEGRPIDEVPMLPIGIARRSSFRSEGIVDDKKRNSKRVAPEIRHEHLFKSGPLAKCNDPYCTTCPAYFGLGDLQQPAKTKYWPPLTGHPAKAWKLWLLLQKIKASFPRGIINPHTKFVQRWNKLFVISCLMAIFVDPLFFFLLRVDETDRCIVMDRPFATVMVVLRSFTDSIYLMHIILQFRLAYVAPASSVKESASTNETEMESFHGQASRNTSQQATWDLVDNPRKIAWHYLKGWFFVDFIAVLPLPQIMIEVVVPKFLGKSAGANYAKNLLRVTLLLQCIPRLFRVLPLLSGHGSTGFIFETAWANFVINLLMYVLAGHVVGSCWYLFGLQRVNQCLHDACRNATDCTRNFLDCGDGGNKTVPRRDDVRWDHWKNNANASNCFSSTSEVFTYGIYTLAVPVTTKTSAFTRYIYSIFWGFQQISTLAGNQMPSLFIWEILFLMCVIGLGLMLLTLLIGNMQNFLQSLGRRGLEMQLRRYEVEKWMTRRHFPTELRRRVRQYERLNWAATMGVNEDELLDDLPEDLHRTIRRVLFMDLAKKVRLLEVMDEQLLDAIFQRLHQKLYIEGSEILRQSLPVPRMLFIVHGRLRSEAADGSSVTLRSGDVCGEELLTWCLKNAASHTRNGKPGKLRYNRGSGQRAVSSRTVVCETSVEAFSLEIKDLEEVTRDFSRVFRNPKLYAAIRYESPADREWAAATIQVHWRYRKRKLAGNTSIPRARHAQQRERRRRWW